MDRGAWQAAVHRVAQSRKWLKQLSSSYIRSGYGRGLSWLGLPNHSLQKHFCLLLQKDLRFPGGSDSRESACNVGELSSILGLGRSPGEGNGNILKYSCLENPMDRGALQATVHGIAKSQTWLSNFTFTFHSHALEKEMATHFSVLAWRIPGMGEPGGLWTLGLHRVGHDWSNLAAAVTY